MVVGTDVEDGMVLAVVPANKLVILLDEREESVLLLLVLLTALHLRQQPRTADNSMGLQQLDACRRLHLAGDDAGQVALYGQYVDGGNLVGLHHEAQCTQEGLRLLALPMEIDAYGDVG